MIRSRQYITAIILAFAAFAVRAQDGSNDPSFNPADIGYGSGDGAQNQVNAVVQLPEGKLLIGGKFLSYDAIFHYYLARLNADGRIDTTFHPGSGPSSEVYALAVQADGRPIIAGGFNNYNGVQRMRIARLEPDGTLDPSFDPGIGASTSIRALAIQADGRILIGGDFTTYTGTDRNRIARLNADGTLDTSFDPGLGADGPVRCMALQADGAVIIGGEFSNYNGVPCGHLARLNADGSLDASFTTGAGADGRISSIALLPDGRIAIVGNFSNYDGVPRGRIALLHNDGSLDTGFDPGSGADAEVFATALRPDGTIVLAGAFSNYAGTARGRIAQVFPDGGLDLGYDPGAGADGTILATTLLPDERLVCVGAFQWVAGNYRRFVTRMNTDGTPDMGFDPPSGVNGTYIWHTAELPDGKLIVGGAFETYNGVPRKNIARLHPDGSLDLSFDPGAGAYGAVLCVRLLANGKILIAGDFTAVDGVPRNRIARLHSDGSLDTSFDPGAGANNQVYGLLVQPDDAIVLYGFFTTVDGVGRMRVARVLADGALDTSFDPGTGANDRVVDAALLADGRILIGGQFTAYNGTARRCVARLTATGALDTSFDPGSGLNNSPNLSACHVITLQADGRILFGGWFSSYNGTPRNNLVRVHANGTVDNTFNIGTGFSSSISLRGILIQPNDQIIAMGNFLTYNGTPKAMGVRLDPNGALDPDFDCGTGVNTGLQCTQLLANGGILIGGRFTHFNGIGRNRIARLHNDFATPVGEVMAPGLAAYPSPSTGRFTLASAIRDPQEVVVTDAAGRVVFRDRAPAHPLYHRSFDLSGHAPGVYTITVIAANERSSARVILQ